MEREMLPCRCKELPKVMPVFDRKNRPSWVTWCANIKCYPPTIVAAESSEESVRMWNAQVAVDEESV